MEEYKMPNENVLSSCDQFKVLKHSTSNPYVFTEQGIAILSGVLRSGVAVRKNIKFMNTFVEMRRLLISITKVFDRLDCVELKQHIFFDGQIYDAFSFIVDIIKKAKNNLILIDNYVDASTLNLLCKKNKIHQMKTQTIHTQKGGIHMPKIKKDTIEAKGFAIQIYTEDFKNDYISLTDIARYKNNDDPRFVIQNWMRNRNTLEYIGLWEILNNPDFNRVQFDTFRDEAGLNRFTMTPNKWAETTNAVGIISKSGRYGGTYAHSDIAMEFASWISPEFKLYIVQDYKRLKSNENSRLSLSWNLNREISKINYKIHTDAIKEYLLKDFTNEQLFYKYANEADMLNVALFNKRAIQWREENPDLKGNMRDYASINELLVLANMESYNAILIGKGIEQKERMIELRKLARTQLFSIEKLNNTGLKSFK
jgi:hypothetical protein